MNYHIKPYYNQDQRAAISNDSTNILVSASAGCGKTSLLVERVIRKIIQDNYDVTDLIIVTFTEAAANELKERLEKALKENFAAGDARLVKQLNLLEEAYISTFHSLCLRLLKESGATFNYGDSIQIIPDLLRLKLKKQAFKTLEQSLIDDEQYQKLREPFINLNNNNKHWFNLLDHTLDKVLNNGGFNVFIKAMPQIKGTVFDIAYFGDILFNKTEAALAKINCKLDAYHEWATNDKRREQVQALKKLLLDISQALADNNYQAIHMSLKNYQPDYKSFQIRKTKEQTFDELKLIHNNIKAIIEDLKALYFLDQATFTIIYQRITTDQLALLTYITAYYHILNNLKKEQGLLEFSDLEQELLTILYDDDNNITLKAQQLALKFKEIMIDEYQDTSITQENIIKAISHDNVFMVGDIKQSIYSFRNATPQLFLTKFYQYQDEGSSNTLINLKYNYRSSNEVLDFANYIFKNIFTKQLGGVSYEKEQELAFGNEKEFSATNNRFQTKVFYQHYDCETESKAAQMYEDSAKAITNEIIKLHKQKVSFSQITILVRNRKHIEILEHLLFNNNIPYMMHGGSGFFNNYEIMDLMSLLSFLTNTTDDIALLALLRSYFCNLDDNDLLVLANTKGTNYWDKLSHSAYQNEYHLLQNLLNKSKEMPIIDLIDYIYDNTPYLAFFNNTADYENILMLLANFKNIILESLDHIYELGDLICLLQERIQVSKEDNTNPAILSQKNNIVNVMTIHKSKGLEFDYVFFFDNQKFKVRFNDNIIHDKLLLDYYDNKSLIKINNPFKKLIQDLVIGEEMAENLRLLYVALTRAKKQLSLFISTKDSKKTPALARLTALLAGQQEWQLDENVLLQGKSFNDLLLLALLRHKQAQAINCYGINSNPDIFNYKDELFTMLPFSYDELSASAKELKPTGYPLKIVNFVKQSNYTKNFIKPSKHDQEKLDFNNIKTFDTYKYGTIIHRIFENLDFTSAELEQDINKQVAKYRLNESIKAGYYAFIEDDLFTTIKNNNYYQEYNFCYLKDNNLINGIIDLLVITDDEALIIDYKSDHLSVAELKQHYDSQLNIYEDFVQQSFPHKKTKKYLFSLVNKCFIEL